ncbi:MAG: hypothetical protein FWH12_03370 [Treponema sp.]|nr:hypothetical protein [Treponema sp.]
MVLEAAGTDYRSSPGNAFSYAVQQGWLCSRLQGSDAIRLDDLSLLIMRAFDIPGGIFYRLTGNSHYAYRELQYLSIIQGRVSPGMEVQGDLLLSLINRVLSMEGSYK